MEQNGFSSNPVALGKLRIAMFVDAFPVLSETFIINQIAGLIDSGHDVDIFSLEQRLLSTPHAILRDYRLMERVSYFAHKPKFVLSALSECLLGVFGNPRWFTPRGFKLLWRIFDRKHGSWGRLAAFRLADNDLRAGGYDVVHCQYGGLGERVLPLVLNGIIRGRLLTSIRGHDVTQRDRYTPEYYKRLFKHGTCFMPVSDSLRLRLLELGCEDQKICVVRSGIDCSKFQFQPRKLVKGQPVRLISVGRMVEMKGFGYAIRAVHQLVRQGFDLRYEIIGDGPLRGKLESQIVDLEIGHNVTLCGPVSHEDLIQHLIQSHIFVMPSVTASNGETEGIPNALKEALAHGMPAIASLHSGIPELVDDDVSGFLVRERDVDAMAKKLAVLLLSPSRWPEMGAAGRQAVAARYDLHVVRESLLACYARALSE